jgi:hypothetical protein
MVIISILTKSAVGVFQRLQGLPDLDGSARAPRTPCHHSCLKLGFVHDVRTTGNWDLWNELLLQLSLELRKCRGGPLSSLPRMKN